jgi:hypothetical protein
MSSVDTPLSAQQAIDTVLDFLHKNMQASLKSYATAYNDAWFAQKIQEYNLLGLMQYATPDALVQSMHALLYAFSHPATREGFCQLCLGVFGQNAIVFIEDAPASVSIQISMQQNNYNFALADMFNFALSGADYATAGTSLGRITNDPKLFLQKFLPAGVILKGLQIEVDGRNTPYKESKT